MVEVFLIQSVLILLVWLPAVATQTMKDDEIKSLPGWSGALPTKHYSGLVEVGMTQGRAHPSYMHYYLQLSEGDPAADPLTLWMNGGPGCTSLKGGFEELGQLVFNYKSLGPNSSTEPLPKLVRNGYSWTKKSNLLMFESPPGVGFSYCEECVAAGAAPDCKCNATDLTTAADNFDAVRNVLARFPELQKNKFFITGESYAGMYIPTLMQQIDQHNARVAAGKNDPDSPLASTPINLVGAAVGNGVGGFSSSSGTMGRTRALFYYGKGLFPDSLRATIETECGSLFAPTHPGWANRSDACNRALSNMSRTVGPHNFYNLADFCATHDVTGATLDQWEASIAPRPDGSLPRMDQLAHEQASAEARLCAEQERNGIACGRDADPSERVLGAVEQWCGVDRSMMSWLANPEVVHAINMNKTGIKNTEKNNLHYKGGYMGGDLTSIYKSLAEKYRLWIYNGQEDGCIPYTGAMEWTSGLGFPVATPWHPWFGDDNAGGARVAAGYSVSYGGGAQDFAFVTVKGAGHEVPTFKPAAAFTLFSNFIDGTPL